MFGLENADVRSIVVAVAVPIMGAIVGGIVQWLIDRRRIAELRQEREDAKQERQKAFNERSKALDEKAAALSELASREAEIKQRKKEIEALEGTGNKQRAKLDDLLTKLKGNEQGLWTSFDRALPFPDFDSRISRRKPIVITIANLKGGVGKTTLVGNLLAFFDLRVQKRVLAIDLDYQGSLTTMLRKTEELASGILRQQIALPRGRLRVTIRGDAPIGPKIVSKRHGAGVLRIGPI